MRGGETLLFFLSIINTFLRYPYIILRCHLLLFGGFMAGTLEHKVKNSKKGLVLALIAVTAAAAYLRPDLLKKEVYPLTRRVVSFVQQQPKEGVYLETEGQWSPARLIGIRVPSGNPPLEWAGAFGGGMESSYLVHAGSDIRLKIYGTSVDNICLTAFDHGSQESRGDVPTRFNRFEGGGLEVVPSSKLTSGFYLFTLPQSSAEGGKERFYYRFQVR